MMVRSTPEEFNDASYVYKLADEMQKPGVGENIVDVIRASAIVCAHAITASTGFGTEASAAILAEVSELMHGIVSGASSVSKDSGIELLPWWRLLNAAMARQHRGQAVGYDDARRHYDLNETPAEAALGILKDWSEGKF